MGAILDLWKSERGIVAVALIAAATTLCGLGVIAVDQWLDYTKWIFVTYAAAKTVTGAVGIAAAQPRTAPAAWQQIEPLITSIVAKMAAERVPAKPEPTPPTPPVAIVPPPPPKVG
jgi:hypothetical protein